MQINQCTPTHSASFAESTASAPSSLLSPRVILLIAFHRTINIGKVAAEAATAWAKLIMKYYDLN